MQKQTATRIHLTRIHFENHEAWLVGRQSGIGGSDAAAAIGLSPYTSNLDLFNLKTGRTAQPDLSENKYVQFGVNAEAPLRQLFAVKNPQYSIEHYPFDILYMSDRPYIRASLDAELTEIETGRKGILEIKTAEIAKRTQREKWNNQIPQIYYVQICHQLAATGYDFVVVFALLTDLEGDCELRTYRFERNEADIEWLVKRETVFWQEHIEKDIPPSLILPTLSLDTLGV